MHIKLSLKTRCPKEALRLAVEDKLNIETARYQLGLKQELDAGCQQAFGITHYIWRAG